LDALLLVDLQNDFMPGGALPVREGNAVVPVANLLSKGFELVVATQDWHPANHASFAVNHLGKKPGDRIVLDGLDQVLWPVHCVEQTRGAALVDSLDQSRIVRVFQKGTDPRIDSYSGFFDNGHRRSTGLGDFLKQAGVDRVFVLGVATDYCVKFTALDARQLGFDTYLVADACRGVELRLGDASRAIDEMTRAGVRVVQSANIIRAGCQSPGEGAG